MNPRSEFERQKLLFESELKPLRADLDRFLAADYDMRNIQPKTLAQRWHESHQPFHWFVEFYGILSRGGFDAIIGNPPYVEYAKVRKKYTVRSYETEDSFQLVCVRHGTKPLAIAQRFILGVNSSSFAGGYLSLVQPARALTPKFLWPLFLLLTSPGEII